MSRCAMPSFPTTTSYAVLGLLSVRSWTTYELAKQVQRSLNWFWPRAERKLYDEP
jgi:PadR family transcriptional regulator AphA